MKNINNNALKNIIITFIAIAVVALLGSFFVNLGMAWYESLIKPNQWIPSFVIPIVWTTIYITFSVVLFLWLKKENLPKNIYVLLLINGILNLLWCLVFFSLKQLFIGNIVIIINTLFSIKLIYEIEKHKKMFALILSIYPTWLCIATSLNIAVWILN